MEQPRAGPASRSCSAQSEPSWRAYVSMVAGLCPRLVFTTTRPDSALTLLNTWTAAPSSVSPVRSRTVSFARAGKTPVTRPAGVLLFANFAAAMPST